MNNYVVCFTPGGSGHFLGHFLHTEFLDTKSGLRVDGQKSVTNPNNDPNDFAKGYDYIQYDPIFKYTNQKSLHVAGMICINLTEKYAQKNNWINSEKKIIRITHGSISERFRISFNCYFKGREYLDLKLHSFTWIMDTFYEDIFLESKEKDNPSDWDVYSPKPWAINIGYSEIFNLYALTQLYYTVHNSVCPDHKIKYAQSYIEQNVSLYNKWEFRAMEKIFMYEYENSLGEYAGGKLRNWSVDDITEENWQTFLDEH